MFGSAVPVGKLGVPKPVSNESSLRLERYSCLARDIEQVIRYRLDQRNPFFAADRFGFALGIAGDQRAGGAGSRLGVAEDVNPFVDVFFEFIFVDEAIDLHSPEEMVDTAWSKGGRLHISGLPECEL